MLRALLIGWLCLGLAGCEAGECALGADCDDGDPCTEDRCRLEVCSHLLRPGCCLADADCPPAGYACEPATRTCVPSGAPAGAACQADLDCLDRQCLEEPSSGAPGGVCAAACDPERPGCPRAEQACVWTLSPFLAQAACLPRFDPAAGCRPHWAPLVALDLASQEAIAVCQPACAPEGCAAGACNPRSGLCGDARTGGAEAGGPCQEHLDCAGLCMGFWTGGYCTSPCRPAAQDCPAGAVCVDLGVQWCCLASCTLDADCREIEGYACHPQARVCIPP